MIKVSSEEVYEEERESGKPILTGSTGHGLYRRHGGMLKQTKMQVMILLNV